MKEWELAKFRNLLQCWTCPHLESVYENYRDHYIYPVCDRDGGIITFEVYDEECPRRIERWSGVSE